MEKVIRNGKVAVLISNGYGAGWSTWNTEHPECLFDPEIVEAVLAKKSTDDIVALAEAKWNAGEGYFYAGGARNLTVEWLPIGTRFQIEEYDGFESLIVADEQVWMVA